MPNPDKLQTLGVFCGAKTGTDPSMASQAAKLGQCLARQRRGLIYGGSDAGLMGTLADAVLAEGGEVTGVIPFGASFNEKPHPRLQRLIKVADLSERKQVMIAESDGFIVLPGGTGTLDELFEVLALSQLGQHRKPCGLLNINGFFESLLAFLQHVCEQGFLHPDYLNMLIVEDSPEGLLSALDHFQHPHRL